MSVDLEQESLKLIRAAAQAGGVLRLFGGLAVQILVATPTLARDSPKDIDCAGLSDEIPIFIDLFTKYGYIEDQEVRRLFGSTRRVFEEPRENLKLDLCLDVLYFARPLDFRQRLKARPFTLSVADLLLSKLQPRDITQKDIIDIINLLITFLPGTQETESEFHLGWFVTACGRDWGLYQLVIENLSQVLSLVQILPREKKERVESSICLILEELKGQPKSLWWKLRSIPGKRIQYWNDVAEELGGEP